MLKDYINIPHEYILASFPTGSHHICNPPVENTDIDFIIYSKTFDLELFLLKEGYTTNYQDYKDEEAGFFISYRKGNINLIVTEIQDYYENFVRATILAKKLNLLEKQQRIDLFNYILHGLL